MTKLGNFLKEQKWVFGLMLCVLLAGTFTSCSHEKRSVKTEVSSDGSSAGSTVTTQKQVTTETHNDSDGGVVSGVFNAVGEIIAFPFRVLAEIFRAIF